MRSVLITGCSDGGMGAELAKAYHKAGFHVYATARDTSKMKSLASSGIQTLQLDVQSPSSIEECRKAVVHLDILVNNAGAQYTMPVTDISITEAKNIFDINVWGNIAVTQAFLPLLRESPKAIIANHTSIGVGMTIPFQSVYNASKAAMSRFSDTLRLELEPFNISVSELRTGGVKTEMINNVQAKQSKLPEGSIYERARDEVEKALRLEWSSGIGIAPEVWAEQVVGDLSKASPSSIIWRGESSWVGWVGGLFSFGAYDYMFKRMTGLSEIGRILRKS